MGLINKDVIKRMRHNEKEEETVELNWDDPNITWQSFVSASVSQSWSYTNPSASSNRFFDVKSGGKKRKRKMFCHGIHR